MPRKDHNLVALDSLDRAVQPLRGAARLRPPAGWIKAVREALGMSRTQLAARIGVAPSTLANIERSEARGTISIATLQKVARGLGAEVTYVLVPTSAPSFEAVLQEQARAVAQKRMRRVSHTMSLEDQALDSAAQDAQLKRAVERVLAGSRRTLWRP